MKIIYCIDHLRPDGTQRVLKQLVQGLAARGHQQTIACLNDSWDAALMAELRQWSSVRVIGNRALLGGWGLVKLCGWLRREQVDACVTLLFFSDVIGRTAARVMRVPLVITALRARNVHYAAWQRWLVRSTMHWADIVVLNSAAVRDFAVSEEGASPERLVVIPNGVDVAAYSQPVSRAKLCAELGLSTEVVLIGSVGRLTPQKGYDVLIEALAQLALTSVHLLLMGTGEEVNKLSALARQLGVLERVHLLGYRRDVPHLLGALDLYVQPSRFEGMPNAVLEAMAAGCPIVASAVDGIQELIADGVHGWLVSPGDASALAWVIDSALAQSNEARRRAALAHQCVTQHFSVDAMVAAWEKALSCGVE